MRTCSVCGTEIDKTTAYTVSGEQKAQGRRCINCVDGAKKAEAKSAPAAKATTEPNDQPAATAAQPVTPQPSSASTEPEKKGLSKTTLILAAIAIIVVLIALD